MRTQNMQIVGLLVMVLVMSGPLSAAVIEWTNDLIWQAPTTVDPNLTVGNLLVDGGAISSDSRGTLNNGWALSFGGRNFTSALTVPDGYQMTVTDWAVEEWQQWNGYLPTFSLSVSGDASADLGSVTATQTSTGGYQTYVLAQDPSDVMLGPGSYTLDLHGHNNTADDNGGWMGLVTYTINGVVEPVGPAGGDIPEPATAVLVGAGLLGLLRRKRR